MHTRHCPRHVLAAPPAHFSGIYVTATWGRFYTGDGWRAAPVEQRMSELHRVVESGVEGCERDGPEGRRLCFGTCGRREGVKPTAYERNISLKNHPFHPVSLPPCLLLSTARPCTSTSGIDSLAILPLTTGYLRVEKEGKKEKERYTRR